MQPSLHVFSLRLCPVHHAAASHRRLSLHLTRSVVRKGISRKAGATAAVYQRWQTDQLAVAAAQGRARGTGASVVINRNRGTENWKEGTPCILQNYQSSI